MTEKMSYFDYLTFCDQSHTFLHRIISQFPIFVFKHSTFMILLFFQVTKCKQTKQHRGIHIITFYSDISWSFFVYKVID